MKCGLIDAEVIRNRLQSAFDPSLVESTGARLASLLARHLDRIQSEQVGVMRWQSPAEQVERAAELLGEGGAPDLDLTALVERFETLVEKALKQGNQLHHPGYIGHQVPPPIPMAAWFDAVGAMTNQVMAIYEMGPWAVAMEQAMVERLGRAIGWRSGAFSGLITHGGNLANLTALLTARNVALPDSWAQGLTGQDESPALLVQSDAHYGVTRAAGILGLGEAAVIPVPVDSRRRMDVSALRGRLGRCRREGRPVIAVVACACATPVGAFDPLPAIAEACRAFDVWLHVDAAHGGSALLSRHHRHLVSGLELADSIVWDAHKMLYVPGLCAFVFYRHAGHAKRTFDQEASYLFDPTAPELEDYNVGLRTIECTKRAAAFGLWGVWSLFGEGLFADLVDLSFSMGMVFFERLERADDFEPLHRPQCNIVVFRYRPRQLNGASDQGLGEFQLRLRRRLVEQGEYYIVSTTLEGMGALRVTIINPLTTDRHLDGLLEALRREGQTMLSEG